jgi:hypothetical protein
VIFINMQTVPPLERLLGGGGGGWIYSHGAFMAAGPRLLQEQPWRAIAEADCAEIVVRMLDSLGLRSSDV